MKWNGNNFSAIISKMGEICYLLNRYSLAEVVIE